MATRLDMRRGTSTEVNSNVFSDGELIFNIGSGSLHVMDGSTAGGTEMARADADNMYNPQFAGTGSLKVPVGTTAQQGTPIEGLMRYNSSIHTLEVGTWDDVNSSVSDWFGIGHNAELLYSRSPTTGTYTATLNENMFNFRWIQFTHSDWSNQRFYNVDFFKYLGTNTATMIDSYNTAHCYVRYTNSGNQMLVSSGSGTTVYQIWGIR